MTANKNESDKKAAGSAPAQSGSRPHATLDLKATEVTPPSAPKDKAGVGDAPAKDNAAASATGATSSSASAPGPSSSQPTSAAKASKPAGTPPPASTAPTRPTPRGYGGFFTHVAAGIAGGMVALLAADILAQQLGFEAPDRPDGSAALEQRIATLESNRSQRSV